MKTKILKTFQILNNKRYEYKNYSNILILISYYIKLHNCFNTDNKFLAHYITMIYERLCDTEDGI